MRHLLSALVLVSLSAAGTAADLDQRRTLTVDDAFVTRVVIEPLTAADEQAKRAYGEGAVLFSATKAAAGVLVKRIARKNGTRVKYRLRPAKDAAVRVRGAIKTTDDGVAETVTGISLKIRGKAPRHRVKGAAGAALLLHDPALTLPAFDGPFVQIVHEGESDGRTDISDLAVTQHGELVAVGHRSDPRSLDRNPVAVAMRWAVEPLLDPDPAPGAGPVFLDARTLGPDTGIALALSEDSRLAAGWMRFPGPSSSDAMWVDGGNGVPVTSLGLEALDGVFQASEIQRDGVGLIAVLHIVVGGTGQVRWDSANGVTPLASPPETIGVVVHDMDARGRALVGDVVEDSRLRTPIAVAWDATGAARTLGIDALVGRDRRLGASVRAVAPDGGLAAGFVYAHFRPFDPDDPEAEPELEPEHHVIWDLTAAEPAAVPIRQRVSEFSDVGLVAGPRAVTRGGLVAGWDLAGAFVWHADWPESAEFRAWLREEAGLELPRGVRDEIVAAVDLVGGTAFAGTTVQREGGDGTVSHWIAFVPHANDGLNVAAPR